MTPPAASLVLCVVRAVVLGDWHLARWAHRESVGARAIEIFDDGADVDFRSVETPRPDPIQTRRALDMDERLRR